MVTGETTGKAGQSRALLRGGSLATLPSFRHGSLHLIHPPRDRWKVRPAAEASILKTNNTACCVPGSTKRRLEEPRCVDICTCIRTHNTHTYTHMHTQAHAHTYTCMYTHVHTQRHLPTHSCTHKLNCKLTEDDTGH